MLSTAYRPPQKNDCLITEIFDCGLLGEDAIRSILDAHRRLLKKNAKIIPGSGRIYAQAVDLNADNLAPYRLDANCLLGANCFARRKPDKGNGDEPYEGERVGDLARVAVAGERVELMAVDFNDVAQLELIVAQPVTKTVQLRIDGEKKANAIVITFELDLDDESKLNNKIGNEGCWEQAVYPLTASVGPVLNATFRLECDGPVLVEVAQEVERVDILVPGRQLAAYRRRTDTLSSLVKKEPFLIWYTSNLDADVIGAMVKQDKKLFMVYHRNRLTAKFEQVVEKLGATKVRQVMTLSDTFMLSLPDVEPLPFYINFLDEYQLPNWPLMDSYLSGAIGHVDLGISAITIRLSFQLCNSKWLEKRVMLTDDNVPENIEVANQLNTFQLVDYPEFDTWKSQHEHLSQIQHATVKLDQTDRSVAFRASQVYFNHPYTSVRYWMTIEHRGLELTTQSCHYVLIGLSNQASSGPMVDVSGAIILENSSNCRDNCGISFHLD